MQYYQHASRQYRTQHVWVRRCCLGVALLTAFVLSASLLSSPSSGVRSSRLVNFNGTETEYSSGMFDRLSGHFQRARDTLWSWGGFWDDMDSDEFWDDAGEEGDAEEDDATLFDEAVTDEERDMAVDVMQQLDEDPAAVPAARPGKGAAGAAGAMAAGGKGGRGAAESAKAAAEAAADEATEEAEEEAEVAALDAASAKQAAAGKATQVATPIGDRAGGKPMAASARAAEIAAEEAAVEAAAEAEEAEASLEPPAPLGKKNKAKAGYAAAEAAVAGENALADLAAGVDARLPALEEAAVEKEAIAEEKEEAAEAAWEKQEELEERIEEAEGAGESTSAAKLVPLVEAAEKEYEAKEADADMAFEDAAAAEAAVAQAEQRTPAGDF